MKWSPKSLERMKGVHPDLINVANKALSYQEMDITVLPDGGVRTPERQVELVAKGVSKTLNSKHLIQKDGFGHALDLAPYPIDWQDINKFKELIKLMKRAATELGVQIIAGGDWKSFRDYPHYELKGK